MELTLAQITLLGLIGSGVTQILKILSEKAGVELNRIVVNIALFIIAVILGAIWVSPNVPPAGDPMEFALALLEIAAGVFGVAALAYEVLLKNVVFPRIGLG